MMPVELTRVASYLDRLLSVRDEADREGNGLVVDATRTVSKVAAAVNTSFDVIGRAEEIGADLLVAHHTTWDDIDLHLKQQKLDQLRRAEISLYAAHESLDRVPDFGTGDSLAALAGLHVEGRFADGQGVYGTRCVASLADLVALLESMLEVRVESWRNSSSCHRIAIATGAGGATSWLDEARQLRCDTYITGEGSLYTKLFAREVGVNLVLGTHCATELPGIRALGQRVASEFGLPCEVIAEDIECR